MSKVNSLTKSCLSSIPFVLLSATSSPCQAKDEAWNIQVEAMYMAVYGNDRPVADILTRTITFPRFTGRVEQTTSNALNLRMDDGFAIRSQLEYRKNEWGAGVSGWWYATDGGISTGPYFSGPPFHPTSSPIILTLVALWGAELIPPPIGTPEGLTLQASNDVEVWNTNFYAIKTLAQNAEDQFDLTFGVKIGNLENKRKENLRNALFTSPTPVGTLFLPGNASHTSRSTYDVMAGPSVGFQGHIGFGKHKMGGFLNQSVLIGDIKQNASFQLTSPVLFSIPVTSVQTFSRNGTDTVPITEVKLEYVYQATDHLALGLGVFASIWWNVPLAPEFNLGSTLLSEIGTWQLRNKTLSFVAGLGSLTYRF
ncbi:MAG: hypothetical protein ACU843_16315 [Gammaproteobacteria bacterium]